MGHKKLIRFEAIGKFKNVLQYPENMKGNWKHFFGNENKITLELACGRGEYSVNLGREHKDRNFIGIDIKGNRIYNGAKTAMTEGLKNVAFLRIQIDQITKYFAIDEVDEIWIVFADPFLKKPKNRLTHPRFLNLYMQILKLGSRVCLKTDSDVLYSYTLDLIKEHNLVIHQNLVDIYGNNLAQGELAIQTYYEKMHLANGRVIYFLSFSLPEAPLPVPERFNKREVDAL